ncbi:reverse transcriptase-like protein [Candidatus Saccharibacteria bacterium]|nr:reverse transcriptase-like protein [Candidatus Saccharibacteria bacterium]
MKQRIRVVGIVKKGEDILLLKKLRGRVEELPSFELPTGKIRFGEQPEEALSRMFSENLGVQVSSVTLKDAITFTGLSGASQMGNLYIVYEVSLPESAKIEVARERYSAYKYVAATDFSGLRLDEATVSVLQIENIRKASTTSSEEARSAANGATVYVDGGSRGNPGPAGIGYYIVGENGEVLRRGGEFIGFATSRVAEYYALKEGIEQALELGLSRVRFVGDNLMMINQMNGIFKVKNRDILPIYNDIQKMLPKFEAVAFVHVRRNMNAAADKEVNRAINRHFKIPGDGGSHSEE